MTEAAYQPARHGYPRTLRLLCAGHIEPKVARVCAWCSTPLSEGGRVRLKEGAQVSHGICLSCREEYFPDLPTDGPKEAA